jgi:hypothetical protein
VDRVSRGAVTDAETGDGGRTARRLAPWILVCILGGLVLRIIGAKGDLWQDEIWTFGLLRTISSPLGIFLDMSADNNHFLNTLYLYYVGPDASPLAQRAFSILLGTATIAAVAFLLRRAHWSAIAFGTALFAFGYPLVHYGSEARGYAGFLLCMVISIGLVERELAQPSRRTRIWLGLSNFAGTLFQPIMVGTVAVLIAWCVWDRWRQGATLRQALATTQKTFSTTVRLLLVVLLLAVVAVYRVGGYKILATEPFDWESVIRGYGGMLRFLLGVPASTPDWVVLAGTLLVTAAALTAARGRLGRRAPLYAIAIFALPAALFCAELPNLSIYRYYLLPSVALLLLMTELFALAWRMGGWRRALALAFGAAFAIGTAVELADFYAYGRGSYQAVTRTIGESESPRVTSNLDGVASTMLEFYAERLRLPLGYVSNQAFCGSGVTWLVETIDKPAPQPDTISFGGPACPTQFHKQAEYPAWGLSGWSWTLYRAAP